MTIDANAPNNAPVSTASPAPTPGPAPVVNDDTSNGPPPIGSAMPVPAPADAPAVNPGQNMDPNAHHSVIGKIFNTLAGGQTTDYVQTDKGPVAVKRDLKPGELARNILASAASLVAAGSGGALAAKQHRPFEMQGPTLGDIQAGPAQARQQEAQQTFQNTQEADKNVLASHRAALEQQEAAKRQKLLDMEIQEHKTKGIQNAADISRADNEAFKKDMADYNVLAMTPGIKQLTDDQGQVITFPPDGDAKDHIHKWFMEHPDKNSMLHDGNYGYIPQLGPDGQVHLFIKPKDSNATIYMHIGQQIDPKTRLPVFYKPGDDIPEGSKVGDPKLADSNNPDIFQFQVFDSSGKQFIASPPVSTNQIMGFLTKSQAKNADQEERDLRVSKTKLEIEKLNADLHKDPNTAAALDQFAKTGDIRNVPPGLRAKIQGSLWQQYKAAGDNLKAKQARVDNIINPLPSESKKPGYAAEKKAYDDAQAELVEAQKWATYATNAYRDYTKQLTSPQQSKASAAAGTKVPAGTPVDFNTLRANPNNKGITDQQLMDQADAKGYTLLNDPRKATPAAAPAAAPAAEAGVPTP